MTGLVVIIAAVIGMLVFALSSNAKVAEIGRLMLMAALIAAMFTLSGRTVHLF